MQFNKLTIAAVLAAGMTGSVFAAETGNLQQTGKQAAAEGKLLLVAFCPGSASQCAGYFQAVRKAATLVMFKDVVVVATPDLSTDAFARDLASSLHGPKAAVYGPDQKLGLKEITGAWGEGTPEEIANALDKWVCAAAVKDAPQVPAVFRQRNAEACKVKSAGISWSPEPEVLGRPH
jgi:hypothetical protein